MSDTTSRVEKVRYAARVLNSHLQRGEVAIQEHHRGAEAILELLDQDWEGEDLPEEWVLGYEQCMVDILDAVADEWRVTIWP